MLMKEITVPDFAQLLAPYIGEIPQASMPAFLARLERTAAERYRRWAEQLPEHKDQLLKCAASEDEIADRIERVLPAACREDIEIIETNIGPAKETYYAVFSKCSVYEQLYIQAKAERQGALAWQGIAESVSDASIVDELNICSRLEQSSADDLDALLAKIEP